VLGVLQKTFIEPQHKYSNNQLFQSIVEGRFFNCNHIENSLYDRGSNILSYPSIAPFFIAIGSVFFACHEKTKQHGRQLCNAGQQSKKKKDSGII